MAGIRILASVALAGLAVSGCSGGGDSAPANDRSGSGQAATGSGASACEILTQADAERALGRPVEKMPADGGPAGLDMCQYGYQGERLMDTGRATLTVHPVDLGSLRQGVIGQGYSAQAVPGLGDDAFWSEEAGLYVGKGNRSATYLVGVGGADPAANKQRAIDLARATVARL